MDDASFRRVISSTSQNIPSDSLQYISPAHIIVQPTSLNHNEKIIFSRSITFIYKSIHEEVMFDLCAKLYAKKDSPNIFNSFFKDDPNGHKLYAMGLDAEDGHISGVKSKPFEKMQDLIQFLKNIEIIVFMGDSIRRSKKLYTLYSFLYNILRDGDGLQLLEHVKGMWTFTGKLCQIEYNYPFGGRMNAGPPPITDAEWAEDNVTIVDSVEEWDNVSNILNTMRTIPIINICYGLHSLIKKLGRSVQGSKVDYLNTLFFHPLWAQFWVEVLSINQYNLCLLISWLEQVRLRNRMAKD
jgi:hypothetical protein